MNSQEFEKLVKDWESSLKSILKERGIDEEQYFKVIELQREIEYLEKEKEEIGVKNE